jgi:hypothetical protein
MAELGQYAPAEDVFFIPVPRRVCEYPDCTTILSRYNRTPFCSVHQDREEPEHAYRCKRKGCSNKVSMNHRLCYYCQREEKQEAARA